MKRAIVLAALLAAASAAAEARSTLTTQVPAEVAQQTAMPVGRLAPTQLLELSFSLPNRDDAGLQALLRDLYDPANPLYRHYLSVAEFTARFGPDAADYAAVLDFAAKNNFHLRRTYANRRVIDVSAAVADIERAFHIEMLTYRLPGQTRVFYAPDSEPSPDLETPLLHISGLDNASPPVSHLVRSGASKPAQAGTGSGPDGNFIGSDVRAAYYGGTTLTGAGQSVGLLEYDGYNLRDVQNYFKKTQQSPSVPLIGVSLNNASLSCTGSCDDSEQVLDIEEAVSMAPGLQELVVYVGHTDVSILNQMAVDDNCKQLSSSWGWKPDPDTLDPIFEEFAAQGQSFVDATGDYGFLLKRGAVWPGDDQYVTGVGGTDLATQGPGGPWSAETGWHFSGGGPSPDGITIPAYQVPFINSLNNGSPALRNVPDIAGDADTDNFSCYDGGCNTGNGGTSYAAPLWAGFLALTNQQAALSGQPPVGFLNPTLYSIGAARGYSTDFHDEVTGFNGAYEAVPGFDLVTGFGSPTGQTLIEALIRGK